MRTEDYIKQERGVAAGAEQFASVDRDSGGSRPVKSAANAKIPGRAITVPVRWTMDDRVGLETHVELQPVTSGLRSILAIFRIYDDTRDVRMAFYMRC